MEKFTLAESDAERKSFFEKLKTETGWPDWKVKLAIEEMNGSKVTFGLTHTFPILEKKEEIQVAGYFEKRKKLLAKYLDLRERTSELLKQQAEIYNEISQISDAICAIEGHRLSKEVAYLDEFPYRTCLICGQKIFEKDLSPNDTVVNLNSELSLH